MKVLLLSLFFSCSSIDAKAPWVEKIAAHKIQRWRICNLAFDGAEKENTGFCRISKECRNRFLAKDECRPKPLYCKFDDIPCFRLYKLNEKTLIEL